MRRSSTIMRSRSRASSAPSGSSRSTMPRFGNQRARKGDALLLAAGDLRPAGGRRGPPARPASGAAPDATRRAISAGSRDRGVVGGGAGRTPRCRRRSNAGTARRIGTRSPPRARCAGRPQDRRVRSARTSPPSRASRTRRSRAAGSPISPSRWGRAPSRTRRGTPPERQAVQHGAGPRRPWRPSSQFESRHGVKSRCHPPWQTTAP